MASLEGTSDAAFDALVNDTVQADLRNEGQTVEQGRQTILPSQNRSSSPAGDTRRTEASRRMAAAMMGDAGKVPAGSSGDWLTNFTIPKLNKASKPLAKRPCKSTDVTLSGFSEDNMSEESDDDDMDTLSLVSGGSRDSSARQGDIRSGKRKAIRLFDENMFDPMDETDEAELPPAEGVFLEKYFEDPIFKPQILERIAETAPAPASVMAEVRRSVDPEILDMVQGKGASSIKDTDKTFLSIDTRLGTALGPLLKAWTQLRRKQERPSSKDVREACHNIEQCIVALGQTHNAVLFGRRKAVLTSFFKDAKRAGDLVKRNQSAFGSTSDQLFGRVFHEALYKKAKHAKHLKEVRKELGFATPKRGHKRPQPSQDRGNNNYRERKQNAKKPFRGGPSSRGKGGGRGGAAASRYGISHISSTYSDIVAGSRAKRERTIRARCCSTATIRLRYRKWHSTRCDFATRLARTAARARRRPTSQSRKKLAKDHVRCMGSTNRAGRADPMGDNPYSFVQRTSASAIRAGFPGTECRDNKTAREECSDAGSRNIATIRGFSVRTTEERRGSPSDFQSETAECVRDISALQNGGLAHGIRHDSAECVHGEIRSERRLPYGTDASVSSTVPPVSVARNTIPVSSVPIRASIRSLDVYQTDETNHQCTTQHGCEDGHILGRYVANAPRPKGPTRPRDHGGLFVRKTGFPYKLGQICLIPDSTDRVSRFQSGFTEHENQSDHRKGYDYSDSMSRIADDDQNFSASFVPSTRPTGCGSAGSVAGTSAGETLANAENEGLVTRSPQLRERGSSIAGMQNGTALVDRRDRDLEREIVHPAESGSSDPIDYGCVSDWLGSSLPRADNSGPLVPRRGTDAHKCLGNEGSSVRVESVSEGGEKLSCACESGQHHHSCQHQQDGQSEISNDAGNYERTLAVLSVSRDHDYCGTFTGNLEHTSRPSIPPFCRPQQLAPEPTAVQPAGENVGTVLHRSVCRSDECSDAPVLQLEARPRSTGDGCILPQMGSEHDVCVSALLPHRAMSRESPTRSGRTDSNNTSVERTTMVCRVVNNDLGMPNIASDYPIPATRDCRGTSPTGNRPAPTTSGMAHFRHRWEMQGFSAGAVEVMQRARRTGTQSAYESAWLKWMGWCSERDTDPFCATVADIVNFMAGRLRDGLEYATLNVYRSALSLFHPEIDGVRVGQHPAVREFMAGAFNTRPPQARYQRTWDVNQVLEHIRTLGDNSQMSMKFLTHKLAMLLALTNVNRAHELQRLNPALIRDHGHYIIWHIDKLTKVKRPSRSEVKLTLYEFTETALDALACLRVYLTRTSLWRNSVAKQEQLFLAVVQPHGPVATSTISRWLKELMAAAGIDVSIFKAHSVRAAACSKAADMGLSVPQIVERANWSSARTFHRFYHKDVLPEDTFQSVILGHKR